MLVSWSCRNNGPQAGGLKQRQCIVVHWKSEVRVWAGLVPQAGYEGDSAPGPPPPGFWCLPAILAFLGL